MPKKKHHVLKFDEWDGSGGGGGGGASSSSTSAPSPKPKAPATAQPPPAANHITKSPLDERRALIAVPAPPLPRAAINLDACADALAALSSRHGGGGGGALGGGNHHNHQHTRLLGAGAFGRVVLAPWEPLVVAAKAAAAVAASSAAGGATTATAATAASPAVAAPPPLPRPPSSGSLAGPSPAATRPPTPTTTTSPSTTTTIPSHAAIKFALHGGERALHSEASALAACGPNPALVRCLGLCWQPARGVCACAFSYCDGGTVAAQLDADAALNSVEADEGLEAAERAVEAAAAVVVAKAAAAALSGGGGGSSSNAPAPPPPPPPLPRLIKPHARALAVPRRFGWRERLLTAYHLAAALAHLHAPKHAAAVAAASSAPPPHAAADAAAPAIAVLHRDVKPANLLLSLAPAGGTTSNTRQAMLGAHLTDLGIAVLVPSSSAPPPPPPPSSAGGGAAAPPPPPPPPQHVAVWQGKGWSGTEAYLDPLYGQLGQLCDRSDVYGAGLVMCELMLGAKEDPREARRILSCALGSAPKAGAGAGAAPPAPSLPLTLRARGWPRVSAAAFARLALRASHHDRDLRPSAAELAAALRALWLKEGGWGGGGGGGGAGGGGGGGGGGAAETTTEATTTTTTTTTTPPTPPIACSLAAAPPAATTTAAAAAAADAAVLERLLAPVPSAGSVAASSLYGGGSSRGGSVPSSPPPARINGHGSATSLASSPRCVASAAATKLAALSIGGRSGAPEASLLRRVGRAGGGSAVGTPNLGSSAPSSRGASPPPRALGAAMAAAALAFAGGQASPTAAGAGAGAGAGASGSSPARGLSPSSSAQHLQQQYAQYHHHHHHTSSPISHHQHHHHHHVRATVSCLDLRLLPGGKAEGTATLAFSGVGVAAAAAQKDTLRLGGAWSSSAEGNNNNNKRSVELWWPAGASPHHQPASGGALPAAPAPAPPLARLVFRGALTEGRLAGEWERRHHHQEKPAPAIEGPALYDLVTCCELLSV